MSINFSGPEKIMGTAGVQGGVLGVSSQCSCFLVCVVADFCPDCPSSQTRTIFYGLWYEACGRLLFDEVHMSSDVV